MEGGKDQKDRELVEFPKNWSNKLQKPLDYMKARNGDHLLTPFECDTCIFRKLQRRDKIPNNPQDLLLLGCIRRANLDAFFLDHLE